MSYVMLHPSLHGTHEMPAFGDKIILHKSMQNATSVRMGNLVKVSKTFISSTKDGKPPMDINVKKPPTYAIHPALPWCKTTQN
jgi:hypothetical protein